MPNESIRIANCSGFMGDRFSAAKEMVEGGPIDALTGDYLAEITMGGLKSFQEMSEDPTKAGFAGNFVFQAQQVLEECLSKQIKIVVNAGGINPQGLAEALTDMASSLSLSPNIAWIEGDNLLPRLDNLFTAGEELKNLETAESLAECKREVKTANAYLGGWGIKAALDAGADIVIAPRTTDAALVLGLAAWKFQWQRDGYDELAGAIVAGHIIECGPQACGGNYSFFKEVGSDLHLGFPIAEVFADGSSHIYKHEKVGGLVSVGTVTEQILYESQGCEYLNPDVTSHFDSIQLKQLSVNRVEVSGVRGSAPPASHKVCINTFGGYKTMLTVPLAGPNAEAKSDWLWQQWMQLCGGEDAFSACSKTLIKAPYQEARSHEESFSFLRIVMFAEKPETLEFNFKAKELELILASIPGFVPFITHGMVTGALSYMNHWPALIDSKYIIESVHVNGETIEVLPSNQLPLKESSYRATPIATLDETDKSVSESPMMEVELGEVFGTRSGDKGGLANLGVWAKDDIAYNYLRAYLTNQKLKELLPDTAEFRIERHELPGIKALNFCIYGYLKGGGDSSGKLDSLAKSLGQYLAGKLILVPRALLDSKK